MQGFGRYCWVAEGFCHNLQICLGKTYQHEVLTVTFHKKMGGGSIQAPVSSKKCAQQSQKCGVCRS